MDYILSKTLYIFFQMLDYILVAYIVLSWIPFGPKIRKVIMQIVEPILRPVRFLLHHSIFQSHIVDFSPIIAFIIISFMQHFFYLLIA